MEFECGTKRNAEAAVVERDGGGDSERVDVDAREKLVFRLLRSLHIPLQIETMKRSSVEDRLPLLRWRISSVDSHEAPQRGGGSPPTMPSLDPKAHRTRLIQQLDAIGEQVQARSGTARDELASREIIAVRPAPKTQLTADQLDDSRADARLVGVIPETGTVRLDVANSDLEDLRKKLEAFADDTKVEVKTHKDLGVPCGWSTYRLGRRALACCQRRPA